MLNPFFPQQTPTALEDKPSEKSAKSQRAPPLSTLIEKPEFFTGLQLTSKEEDPMSIPVVSGKKNVATINLQKPKTP
jgi:hypothetical protein